MNLRINAKKLILVCNITLILLFIFSIGCIIKKNSIKDYSIYATSVYLEAGNYHGNGSIIKKENNEIVIVTTKHLLNEGNQVTITFSGGEIVASNVMFASKNHDIGFVKVPADHLSENTYNNIKAIKYKKSVYKKLKQDNIMQYVYMDKTGFIDIQKGKIGNSSWYVEEFNDYMLYNYCNANAGMSGCGAFTENNYYIGMLIGGYDNESVCLPLPTILEIYRQEVS